MAQQPQHRVSIIIGGTQVDGWTDYDVSSSLIDAVDHFTLRRPFDSDVYRLCVPDALVTVRIDNVPIITGYIDDREKDTDKHTSTMMIMGRDKAGRLVQESAPEIGYDGLDLVTVVTRLASPWFTAVELSGARDRIIRLGRKGRKAAAGNEALIVKVKKKTWQHEPGQARWKIISDLCSEAGYMVRSSADGKTLIIGKVNYTQGIQFLISNPTSQSFAQATALKMNFKESVADRYSLIMAIGSGRGDIANYGASTVSRRDIVRNGPGIDGTGVDFIYPKRLILAERSLVNNEEAHQYAQLNMDRRDFHKLVLTATMAGHGQITGGGAASLYTCDTLARVIDGEQDLAVDAAFVIFSCRYHSSRSEGETTELQLVPRGTVFAM